MAKLLTKKGKIVECNILNESFETYVVEYNGKVGQVKKNRIISINSIDESVLDKIKSRAKKLVGKILKKWVQVIYDQDTLKSFVHSPDNEEDGSPSTLEPIGISIIAANNGVKSATGNKLGPVNYYVPCEATRKYAKSIGLPATNVINNPVSESVNESGEVTGSARVAAANSNRITLKALGDYDPEGNPHPGDEDTFIFDVDYEDAMDMILELYNAKAKYPNYHPKYAPCFLGAPGNAKSALINDAVRRLHEQGYKDAEGISVILSGHAEGTLYMSAPKQYEIRGRNNKTMKKEDWVQTPMLGIPAYPLNTRAYSAEEMGMLKDNANGLLVNDEGEVVKEAEGGIFVIDEFTRSNEDTMRDVMNILSGNTFGTNLIFGDRWVVIVCGNRKRDMENLAAAQDMNFDSAQRTRLAIHNMVLQPEEFINWAQRPNAAFNNLVPNIIPEITAFIKACGDKLYNVQISDDQAPEYFNVWQDAANARSWEGVSNEFYNAIVMQDPTFTKMNCLTDLIQSNPAKYNDSWLKKRIAAHIGVNIAVEFVNFLHTMEFGREEALDVYETGTCRVKQAGPSAMIPIVDRLVQCNPGYLQYGENVTADQLFTGDQLVNIINYLYNLCRTVGGQGSGGETGPSTLRRNWSTFQTRCVEKYKALNGMSLIHNYTELDPEDPGTEEHPNFIPKPGYEKFLILYNKYLSENQAKIEAMQAKGLI